MVEALRNLAPGGRLVINAIRKEAPTRTALLDLDYPAHLWLEKEIKSVANVTRGDVSEFLALAAEIPIVPEVQEYASRGRQSGARRVESEEDPGGKGAAGQLSRSRDQARSQTHAT